MKENEQYVRLFFCVGLAWAAVVSLVLAPLLPSQPYVYYITLAAVGFFVFFYLLRIGEHLFGC